MPLKIYLIFGFFIINYRGRFFRLQTQEPSPDYSAIKLSLVLKKIRIDSFIICIRYIFLMIHDQ